MSEDLHTSTERHLHRVLRLTREMLSLADRGDLERGDDSCGILYGILRDAAYNLRRLTEQELWRVRRERGPVARA